MINFYFMKQVRFGLISHFVKLARILKTLLLVLYILTESCRKIHEFVSVYCMVQDRKQRVADFSTYSLPTWLLSASRITLAGIGQGLLKHHWCYSVVSQTMLMHCLGHEFLYRQEYEKFYKYLETQKQGPS
jgi:hypothetical protein